MATDSTKGRYLVRPNSGQPLSQTYPGRREAIGAASKLGPGRHLVEQPPIEVVVTVQVPGEEPLLLLPSGAAAPPVPDPPAAVAPPAAAAGAQLALTKVGARVFGLCMARTKASNGHEAPAFKSWAEMWKRYTGMHGNTRFSGAVVLVMTAAANDYAAMRYGLATALLGDGGFSLIDAAGHGVMPWFDEYDAELGVPVDPVPQTPVTLTGTTYMRRYQGGAVFVNTSAIGPDTIAVPSGYRRINGNQDPEVNSGATVSDLRLPAHSGILLVKARP